MPEVFGMVIMVAVLWFVGWALFEWPEIIIVLIAVGIFVGMCTSTTVTVTDDADTEETVDVAPTKEFKGVPTVDSVTEKCIDGVVYLLISEDGTNFVAPKENRYGDNERCYE